MITPGLLDLPAKFKEFRPEQVRMAARAASMTCKCLMIDAPTGTGKTLIGAAAQRWLKQPVLYVVTTKQLQDQIIADYPYAKVLKGRNEYPCLKHPNMVPPIMADMCTNSKEDRCPYVDRCPYIIAKEQAIHADLAVLNTAYYLIETNFVGTFDKRHFVILDEFDMIEDQLMSFIELKITMRLLDRLGLEPPKFKTKFESWTDWAGVAKVVIDEQLRGYDEIHEPDLSFNDLRHKRSLQNFRSRLEFFINNVGDDWVWYPAETEWSFKPVWVSKYAKGAIWNHADHFLGMSATILNGSQMARNIGLEAGEFEYEQLDSPFPKEHRPIFFIPAANCTHAETETAYPKILAAIDDIIAKYPDKKGLIHTVSYKLAQYVMQNTRHQNRVISHTSMNRNTVIDTFKRSARPLVLVSPSAERGIDLPQEQCRFIIIAKVPYPNLADAQVKKRTYAHGGLWYAYKTISTIIQASGRGVRSIDDYCDTYIIDNQFGKLMNEHRNFFPRWYWSAISKKS